MLQPGEYFSDHMTDYEKLEPDELKALTAFDSLGRTYKAPKKEFEEVKRRLLEMKGSA